MVLILTRFVDQTLLDSRSTWLERAFSFFDTMISSGNRIAEFRVVELRKLEEMLSEYTATRGQDPTTNPTEQTGVEYRQCTAAPSFVPNLQSPRNPLRSEDTIAMYTGLSDESSGFGDDLTTEQILAVAESMDLGDTDWLSSFATMDDFPIVDPTQL